MPEEPTRRATAARAARAAERQGRPRWQQHQPRPAHAHAVAWEVELVDHTNTNCHMSLWQDKALTILRTQ